MKNNWFGLMKVLEFSQWRNGKIVQQVFNKKNLLHAQGEKFLLEAVFVDSSIVPEAFYVGLDNRTNPSVDDNILNLISEPSSAQGYTRVELAPGEDFVVDIYDGHYRVVTPVLTFRADSGGLGWGPVSNVFIADTNSTNDPETHLISTSPLESAFFLEAGDTVTLRLQLQLQDCSTCT